MSERCFYCFRPKELCLCKYVTPAIDTGIKFIFLMHPKEAKHQRTGTGRISHVALKDSEILVGLDFSKDARLNELLQDKQYYPVLLYPGDEALKASDETLAEKAKGKTLLVIIIDATWFCSRKIIEHTPSLLLLPRLTFAGSYESIFTFKKEPRPEYISTIESCYYLSKELQEGSLANKKADLEPLMNAFKRMIQDQLQAENDRIAGLRPSNHAYDWKYKKTKDIPKL